MVVLEGLCTIIIIYKIRHTMNICTLFETALTSTPDKTALICAGESCTYAELEQHTSDYARAFINLGLGKGDRLGLFMYNRWK